jgi:tetratricopeptide (TPR) repeat protein
VGAAEYGGDPVTATDVTPLSRLAIRGAFAGLVLIAIGLAYAAFEVRRGGGDIAPFVPTHAVTHEAAAASQQGVPTTADEQLSALNHDMAFEQKAVDAHPADWGMIDELANLYLARARLTGSFDDYAMAGTLYDKAFAVAPAGRGPHLDRAMYNFTVHRLGAVETDLRAVDHYAVPDTAETATVIGLRGDLAFYAGRYREALALYERSHRIILTVPTCFRLANYWGRMGDPDKALRYLDQAESLISGPQQQQRNFLELHRGVLALDRGLWNEAEAHFRRAEAIFPGNWLVRQHLAMVLALKGRPDQAMAIYKSIAARNNLPEAADAVAGLYRATGDFENAKAWAARAEALWNRRLDQLPEAAYGHAVDHLLAFGTPAQSLSVALRNYQTRPYADAAAQLAWAFMVNHRPQDALKTLAPVLASGWVSAEPHVVAAEAHALLGEGPAADAERKAALAINPHSLDRNPGLVWLEE